MKLKAKTLGTLCSLSLFLFPFLVTSYDIEVLRGFGFMSSCHSCVPMRVYVGSSSLTSTDYHLNIRMCDSQLSKLQDPTALFEFSIAHPNTTQVLFMMFLLAFITSWWCMWWIRVMCRMKSYVWSLLTTNYILSSLTYKEYKSNLMTYLLKSVDVCANLWNVEIADALWL